MRLWGIIFLILLTACGGSADETESRQFTVSETGSNNSSGQKTNPSTTYRQACQGLSGRWSPLDKFDLGPNVTAHHGTHICNLPAADAGKSCEYRFTCQGRCINPDSGTGKGNCSDSWLVDKTDKVFPAPKGRGNPGEPPPVSDKLYAEKIDRIKEYVIHRHLWENHAPTQYKYVHHFDGGFAVSVNPLPAMLTIKNRQVIAAHYIGANNLHSIGDVQIENGDKYQWQGRDPLNFFWSHLANAISRHQTNDLLEVTYHPDFGLPIYMEHDTANTSDSWARIEFKNYQPLTE